jgi:hypothetical protein
MYCGLIPFVMGAIATVQGIDEWWIVNNIPVSFALYALAIASFMSGIHWGIAQHKGDKSTLLIVSNLLVVLPWIVFTVLGSGALFYLSLAYVFLKQYLIDRELTAQGLFSPQYLTDRTIVASTVCALMLIVAAFKFI